MERLEENHKGKEESIEQAHLEAPSAKYKESFLEALREFEKEGGYGHYAEEDLQELPDHFEAFLEKIEELDTPTSGSSHTRVPQTDYWLVSGNEYIGRVSIRHELNEYLEKVGGHIGYDIRPTERQKGYGKRILELGLEKARELGLEKVLLTCHTDNTASRKIIERNGGVLRDEIVVEEGGPARFRFWIELAKI